MKQYLCIDIDSGVFRYGIVTEELDVLDTGRVTFPITSKDELFEPLADICEQYEDDVEGVSITMPGVIDEKKGMAYRNTCPYCGAFLDPGEACDCLDDIKKAPAFRAESECRAPYEGVKNGKTSQVDDTTKGK